METRRRTSLNGIGSRSTNNVNSLSGSLAFSDAQGSKTITRSFRLAESLDNSIISAASKRRITPSTLLNQILRGYFAWYQYASGDGSPFVMVVDQFLLGVTEKMDDAAIAEMARGPSLDSTLDFIKFRFHRIDIDSILEFIDLMSANMNVGNFGVLTNSNSIEIRIRHSLGSKWSVYIVALLSGLFEVIPDAKVESKVSNIGVSIGVVAPGITVSR